MTTTAREARNKPLQAGLRLSAAVLAATLAGGCSGGQPPAVAARPQATATVLSWGSFFGGRPGSFGTRTSPAAVRLPRKVAEVGTSNGAQYALLADGSLYAWGLGTQGELGDGSTASSFTRPVRVRFPAGVKIASIPTDACRMTPAWLSTPAGTPGAGVATVVVNCASAPQPLTWSRSSCRCPR